jgi:hypothetical protein
MKKIIPFITGINLIIAVVLINIFLSFYPFLKIDLSQGKIHSLSTTSKTTIKKLDDVVNVKVYMTSDLPPEIKPTATNLKAILADFQRLNKSKFRVTYLDPSKSEDIKLEAEKAGIRAIQFSSIKNDKFEAQGGYLGLVLNYNSKQQVLPIAGDVSNLEYFIVSEIKKIISKTTPIVAIVQDNTNETQYFRKFLEKIYTVKDVKIDGDEKLPEEAQTLLIVGRKTKIDDKGLVKIKDWVKNGKGLIVFMGKVEVSQSMTGQKNEDTGLENILKDNGMEIENKLVFDSTDGAVANFKSNNGSFLSQYPYWIQIRPENINKSIPVVSGISSLIMPWASPIDLKGSAVSLFTSSKNSVKTDNFADLSPLVVKNQEIKNTKKEVLGAMNTKEIKIAVVADDNFIKDQFVVNSQQNLYLALNLTDYFSQDSSLLSIRSKSIKMSPLISTTDNFKLIIKIVNIALPIVLLVGTVIIFNFRRNENNKKFLAN